MIRSVLTCLGLLVLSSAAVQAKEGPLYLYRFYGDADAAARVAVVSEREVEKNLVEYELLVLKPIKGVVAEKKLRAVLEKVRPIDSPHVAVGEVGIIFLQKDKAGDRFRVTRFLPAQDLVVNTNLYLCKSPDEHCEFTKASEVENFFKTR